MYRAFHPKIAAYTFCSVHRTFSRIDHKLGHRDSLNKYERVEIILTIFSDHNALKLEISCKKKAERTTNTWRLNNILLKNNWFREESKREIKKYIETNDSDSVTFQNYWDTAKAVNRGQFVSLQAYSKNKNEPK